MRGDGIIAGAMALCAQLKQTFAGFEAGLDFPPKTIDLEDALLIKIPISADKADPVFLIAVVPGKDELRLHFGPSIF